MPQSDTDPEPYRYCYRYRMSARMVMTRQAPQRVNLLLLFFTVTLLPWFISSFSDSLSPSLLHLIRLPAAAAQHDATQPIDWSQMRVPYFSPLFERWSTYVGTKLRDPNNAWYGEVKLTYSNWGATHKIWNGRAWFEASAYYDPYQSIDVTSGIQLCVGPTSPCYKLEGRNNLDYMAQGKWEYKSLVMGEIYMFYYHHPLNVHPWLCGHFADANWTGVCSGHGSCTMYETEPDLEWDFYESSYYACACHDGNRGLHCQIGSCSLVNVEFPNPVVPTNLRNDIYAYSFQLTCQPGFGLTMGDTSQSPNIVVECDANDKWKQVGGITIDWTQEQLCKACPPGRYSNDSSLPNSRCLPCPAGLAAPSKNMTTCEPCAPACKECEECVPDTGLCKLRTGKCLIRGKCYKAGSLKPDDPGGCSSCRPDKDPIGWWPRLDDKVYPIAPDLTTLCHPNSECREGKLWRGAEHCNPECEECKGDQVGCRLLTDRFGQSVCLGENRQCGCNVRHGEQNACIPWQMQLNWDGTLSEWGMSMKGSCKVSSKQNNYCTGDWVVGNQANGYDEEYRGGCVNVQDLCTHGGNCETSVDGECPATPNTVLQSRPVCSDRTKDICDGHSNNVTFIAYPASANRLCHAANLTLDACSKNVTCGGHSTDCLGRFRHDPNLNTTAMSFDFASLVERNDPARRWISDKTIVPFMARGDTSVCGTNTYYFALQTGACADSENQTPISYQWSQGTTAPGPSSFLLVSPLTHGSTVCLVGFVRDMNFGGDLGEWDTNVQRKLTSVQARVDHTPPVTGEVHAGGFDAIVPNAYPSTEYITFYADQHADTQSGLDTIRIDVLLLEGNSTLTSPPLASTSFFQPSSVLKGNLSLSSKLSAGSRVILRKTVINNAGLSSSFDSTPIIMDDTPPIIEHQVIPCDPSGLPSIDPSTPFYYQHSRTQLTVCIDGAGTGTDTGTDIAWRDGESGISEQQYEVLSSEDGIRWIGGNGRLRSWPLHTRSIMINGSYDHGVYYAVRMRANNTAGVISEWRITNAIMVDEERPVAGGLFIQSIYSIIHDYGGTSVLQVTNHLSPNQSQSDIPSLPSSSSSSLSPPSNTSWLVGPLSAITTQSWSDRIVVDWNDYVKMDRVAVVRWWDRNSGLRYFECGISGPGIEGEFNSNSTINTTIDSDGAAVPHNHTHPHHSTPLPIQWTQFPLDPSSRHLILSNLSLLHNASYVIYLRATDQALNTMLSTTSVLVDLTPPDVIELGVRAIDLDADEEVNFMLYPGPIRMHINGYASDEESGFGYYKVCVGRQGSGRIDDAYPCTYIGQSNGVQLDPMLFQGAVEPGQWFIFTLQAFNHAGGHASVVSKPVQWNILQPVDGVVMDGPAIDSSDIVAMADAVARTAAGASVIVTDMDYQVSTTTLSAHWTNFSFTTTDIGYYTVAFGTYNVSESVMEWMDVGLATNFTVHLPDLDLAPLQPFATYYAWVRCFKRDTLEFIMARSNGVRIVTQHPVPGQVMDGPPTAPAMIHMPIDANGDYQSNRSTFYTAWFGFSNRFVPLRYTVTLQSIEDVMGLHAANVTLPFTIDAGRYTNGYSYRWQTPSFDPPLPAGLYRTRVCAFNPVGMRVCAVSDGVVLDEKAPHVADVKAGPSSDEHRPHWLQGEELAANWRIASLALSGIRSFEWSVGSVPGLSDLHDWTDVGLSIQARYPSSFTRSLPIGQIFFINVKCNGNNGNVSLASSPSIAIVATPEIITRVYFGPAEQAEEDAFDGLDATDTIDPNAMAAIPSPTSTSLPLSYVNSTSSVSAWFSSLRLPYYSPSSLRFSWALGYAPFGATLQGYRPLTQNDTLAKQLKETLDGRSPLDVHVYYITVIVENQAGVTFARSSRGVVIDSQPPNAAIFNIIEANTLPFTPATCRDDDDLDRAHAAASDDMSNSATFSAASLHPFCLPALSSQQSLSISWQVSSVPLSGFRSQEFAIATSSAHARDGEGHDIEMDVSPWTVAVITVNRTHLPFPQGVEMLFSFTNLNLQHGHVYWLYGRTTSRSHLTSIRVQPFLVDLIPPRTISANGALVSFVHAFAFSSFLTSTLFDASTHLFPSTQFCQSRLDRILAQWLPFAASSGIATYRVSLGLTPLSADMAGWREVGNVTQTQWDGLHLTHGQVVYVGLCAVAKGGLETCEASGGLLISAHPPHATEAVQPRIVLPSPASLSSASASASVSASTPSARYHSSRTSLTVDWSGVFDGSVHSLSVSVGTSVMGQQTLPWTPLTHFMANVTAEEEQTATTFPQRLTLSGLDMLPGVAYIASISAMTCSGLSGVAHTPPSVTDPLGAIGGALKLHSAGAHPLTPVAQLNLTHSGRKIDYVLPHGQNLSVSWSGFRSSLSPIVAYRIRVGQASKGSNWGELLWHEVSTVAANISVASFCLPRPIHQLQIGQVEVTAVKESGAEASIQLSFIVNSRPSPPLSIAVTTAMGAAYHTPSSFMCQQSRSQLHARWEVEPHLDPAAISASASMYSVGLSTMNLSQWQTLSDSSSNAYDMPSYSSLSSSPMLHDMMINWISVQNRQEFTFNQLQLDSEQPYYILVKSVNWAGIESIDASFPIYVVHTQPHPATSLSVHSSGSGFGSADESAASPPTFLVWNGSPYVRDRLSSLLSPNQTLDRVVQGTPLLHIHWIPLVSAPWMNSNSNSNAWKNESERQAAAARTSVRYEYAIGTSKGGRQAMDWTSVDSYSHSIHYDSQSTPESYFIIVNVSSVWAGVWLYPQVRATGCSGVQSTSVSTGVLIDESPPTVHALHITGHQHIDAISYLAPLHLQPFQFRLEKIVDDASPIDRIDWWIRTDSSTSMALNVQTIRMTHLVNIHALTVRIECMSVMPGMIAHVNSSVNGTGWNALSSWCNMPVRVQIRPLSLDPFRRFHAFNLSVTVDLDSAAASSLPAGLFVVGASVGSVSNRGWSVNAAAHFDRAPPSPPKLNIRLAHQATPEMRATAAILMAPIAPRESSEGTFCASLAVASQGMVEVYWSQWRHAQMGVQNSDQLAISIGDEPNVRRIVNWTEVGSVTAVPLTALLSPAVLQPNSPYTIHLRITSASGWTSETTAPSLLLMDGPPTLPAQRPGFGTDINRSLPYWTDNNRLVLHFHPFMQEGGTNSTASGEMDTSSSPVIRYVLSVGTSQGGSQLLRSTLLPLAHNISVAAFSPYSGRLARVHTAVAIDDPEVILVVIEDMDWYEDSEGYELHSRVVAINCAGEQSYVDVQPTMVVRSPPRPVSLHVNGTVITPSSLLWLLTSTSSITHQGADANANAADFSIEPPPTPTVDDTTDIAIPISSWMCRHGIARVFYVPISNPTADIAIAPMKDKLAVVLNTQMGLLPCPPDASSVSACLAWVEQLPLMALNVQGWWSEVMSINHTQPLSSFTLTKSSARDVDVNIDVGDPFSVQAIWLNRTSSSLIGTSSVRLLDLSFMNVALPYAVIVDSISAAHLRGRRVMLLQIEDTPPQLHIPTSEGGISHGKWPPLHAPTARMLHDTALSPSPDFEHMYAAASPPSSSPVPPDLRALDLRVPSSRCLRSSVVYASSPPWSSPHSPLRMCWWGVTSQAFSTRADVLPWRQLKVSREANVLQHGRWTMKGEITGEWKAASTFYIGVRCTNDAGMTGIAWSDAILLLCDISTGAAASLRSMNGTVTVNGTELASPSRVQGQPVCHVPSMLFCN